MENKTHYRDCKSKIRYASEHEALKQARKSEAYRAGQKLDTYYCSICHGWHLTSTDWIQMDLMQPKKKRKKKRYAYGMSEGKRVRLDEWYKIQTDKRTRK